jgi:hypothetical protein
MMTRRGIAWSITAILGIVCTAAVAWTAGQLAGQHIGLSSEPFAVARGLAPTDREPPGGERHTAPGPARHHRSKQRPAKPVALPTSPASATVAGNQSTVTSSTTSPQASVSPPLSSSTSAHGAAPPTNQTPSDSTGGGGGQRDDNGGQPSGSGGHPDD